MTILSGGAYGMVVLTSGSLIPAAVGTLAGMAVTGVRVWFQSEPVKVALATAVGAGTSAGAITGATVSKTAAHAVSGAIVGGLSASGVGSILAGGLAAGGALAANPYSLLTVGTSITDNSVTFDCWKPVVRDMSEEPSRGMVLADLMSHPNVSDVTVTPAPLLPKIVVENIWSEKYELEYVVLRDSDQLYCHAARIRD